MDSKPVISNLPEAPARPWGLLAEYETPQALLAAAARVRDAGFTCWDAHTPYPVHGLDAAMGLPRTRLPWLVFACGVAGFSGGLALQWYTNAWDYPYLISGKPLFSIPAAIPVCFELTILLAAGSAFLGMLVFNGLPELYHVLFTSRRFRLASNNRFFIALESRDPRFECASAKTLLRESGATAVEVITENQPEAGS